MLRQKIGEIQSKLNELHLDGWLLYDFHGSNRFVKELLSLELTLTRRFFLWIPKTGKPLYIVHGIEEEFVEELVWEKKTYLSWQELDKTVDQLLKGAKTIAMEYSPLNANPYIASVDAGTLEWIKSRGIEIVSSSALLQQFSLLTEEQIHSHLVAASVLAKTIERAWDLIGDHLRQERKITEYDVEQFILSEFIAHGCITEGTPFCAVNGNSAMPHYIAKKESAKVIQKGDFILIDLWCKRDIPHAIYADITRVAAAHSEPTPRQNEIFEIVREAQKAGTELVKKRFSQKKPLTGSEVDECCRSVIEKAGYGNFFTHRTGHNIDTSVHGAGAHLDNFETSDRRVLLPSTCFSIEPGIYLPGEFGVRLEYDVLIRADSSVEVTGGIQENIHCLL